MLSTYFEILGVSQAATEQEIKRAYKQKAKLYHPDLNKSPDAHSKFLLLKKAYEVLINHKRKYSHKSSFNSNKPNPYYYTPPNKFNYQGYDDWAEERKREKAFQEEIKQQEFQRIKKEFQASKWFQISFIGIYVGAGFFYFISLLILIGCFYLIIKTHILFTFVVSPFICLGIFLFKYTSKTFASLKTYFE